MSETRLASRGLRAVAAAVSLAALSGIFSDPIIAAGAAAILAVLAGDYASLKRRESEILAAAGRWPNPVKARITSGARKRIALRGRLPPWATLKSAEPWARVFPASNGYAVELRPEAPGEQEQRALKAVISSRLGLYVGEKELPLLFELKVLPRSLPLIAEAVRLLALYAAGSGEPLGEQAPQTTRGSRVGTEYIGDREYVEGDDVRRIDWKATSRIGRLVVKEFSEELGSVALVFRPEALGPRTADELYAAALTLALASLRMGAPVTYLVSENDELKLVARRARAITVLEDVVSRALRAFNLREPELVEYVGLKPSRKLLEYLGKLAGKTPRYLRRKAAGAAELVDSYMASSGLPVYVGVSTVKPREIVDIAAELRARGRRLVAALPQRPWLDAPSLEEAYRVFTTHRKVLESLSASDAIVLTEHESLEALAYEMLRG